MTDLDRAIAAAREALEGTHAENDYRHYGWAEFRALLAALDAARAGGCDDNCLFLCTEGGTKPRKCAAPPAALAVPAASTVSGLTLAAIGVKHFGNPIPAEWYAAARELLAQQPAAAVPAGYALVKIEHLNSIKEAAKDPSQPCYQGRGLYDDQIVFRNWSSCIDSLSAVREVLQDIESEWAAMLAAANKGNNNG